MNMSMAEQAKWIVTGTVDAPAEQVAQVLLDVREGDAGVEGNALVLAGDHAKETGGLTLEGGPAKFTGRFGDSGEDYLEVDVDREAHSVRVQTWYGGTYTVEPADGGTQLVLRVHNLVPNSSRFGQKVAQIGVEARLERRLQAVLTAIGERLGCATRVGAALK
ncbi:SRPBCC family protein [Streptomyces sp. NPDC054961]